MHPARVEAHVSSLSMSLPPPEVLAEFGAPGGPVPLADGRGAAWRVGDVVLKPLDMSPAALEWQADVLGSLPVPRRS